MSNDLYLHLYRRAGFGASTAELHAAQAGGWQRTVRNLIDGFDQPDQGAASIPDPQFASMQQEASNAALRAGEFLALTNWWVERMTASTTPLREKLTLLLHDQFPTAYSKVYYPGLLYRQNQIFRTLGAGSFTDLNLAAGKDPAMLIWLDANSDLAAHPNENYARELMERFALGVGHYTEYDVKEGARCFTGWSLNYSTAQFYFNASQHDPGPKRFLGRYGPLTGEQAIEIVCRTEESARYLISRLFSWLAYPVGPKGQEVNDLLPSYMGRRELKPLLESILLHPAFVSPKSTGGLVKQPAEYVVGTLRALGMTPSRYNNGYIMNVLTQLGQQLFNPPTVGGWGDNIFWLNTATSLVQLNFALTTSNLADLTRLEETEILERPKVLAEILGVARWSKNTTNTLAAYAGQPNKMLSLALVSPEYIVN